MSTIDLHCHVDMLPDPEEYLIKSEISGNITICMTNLPSHFCIASPHFENLKKSRLALGLHPLLAADNLNELPLFKKFLDKTSYIGEIGLDFSKEGVSTKEQQITAIRSVLSLLKGKRKIISIHSRGAESELLALLQEYDIKNVVFHWYSGKISLIQSIINQGYYFSINEAMTNSISGKKIIESIPINRIITETDAPFNKKSNLLRTYDYLHSVGCSKNQIAKNLQELLSSIK